MLNRNVVGKNIGLNILNPIISKTNKDHKRAVYTPELQVREHLLLHGNRLYLSFQFLPTRLFSLRFTLLKGRGAHCHLGGGTRAGGVVFKINGPWLCLGWGLGRHNEISKKL